MSHRKSKQTGYYVGVYDGEKAGLDTTAGKWSTICEEHHECVAHKTKALALSHAVDPRGWCEGCMREKQIADKLVEAGAHFARKGEKPGWWMDNVFLALKPRDAFNFMMGAG